MSEIIFQSDSAQIIKVKGKFGSGVWQPVRLVVTKDAWYVFDLGIALWAYVLGHQFGLLGMLVYEYFKKRKMKATLQSFANKSPEEILMMSPKHLKLDLNQVKEFSIKDGGFKNLGLKAIHFQIDETKYQITAEKNEFEQLKREFQQVVSPDKRKK